MLNSYIFQSRPTIYGWCTVTTIFQYTKPLFVFFYFLWDLDVTFLNWGNWWGNMQSNGSLMAIYYDSFKAFC